MSRLARCVAALVKSVDVSRWPFSYSVSWRQSNQRLVAGVEELLNENGQRADSCLGKKLVSSASAKDSMQLLIVDDHKLFGTGLRLLIEYESGMKVVGQAWNKTEALALATS